MATILLVEDDPDLLFLYQTALAGRRHTILQATSSADAMRYLSDETVRIDAAVLDMGMPDTPGTLAVETIRHNPRLAHIKIIVVTANEYYRDKLSGVDLDGFFMKPVNIAALIDKLEELVAV